MAAEYSVSRGTIRETMKLLSASQLVESSRGAGGGTFVRLPEPGRVAATLGETVALWFSAGSTTLKEINDARVWIELGCVRFAAGARTDADLAAIRATVEAMEAPGVELEQMLEIDIRFHVAVSRAAHNAALELAMSAIHLVRPFSNTMLMPYLSVPVIAAQHRAIYEAIEAGDADAAEAAHRATWRTSTRRARGRWRSAGRRRAGHRPARGGAPGVRGDPRADPARAAHDRGPHRAARTPRSSPTASRTRSRSRSRWRSASTGARWR